MIFYRIGEGLIHDITKTQYINDPCGTCSLAFWKNSTYKKPDNIKVIHKRFYRINENINEQVEFYFRLLHNLEKINKANLKTNFYFQSVNIDTQKELAAKLINECYSDIGVDENDIISWTNTKVFDSDLWIFVFEKASGQPVALGIADYDTEINEGSLEWIQVLPQVRKNGFGEAIVNELLLRLKSKGAKFVTVSGKTDNESKPELLYRKCGFTGDDIWCVIK